MLEYIKNLITPDMVSLWVPSGLNRAQDLIRGNHGQCYGTHPNVPVISVPYSLNTCDAVTDWTGTSLSIDTDDKKEGTGSLKDDVAVPVAGSFYNTIYNPTGTWDWSDKKHILFWFKSDRANTAFTSANVAIVDTLNNYRNWNLTFSAGEWTAVKKLLSTGDGQSPTPPNLALINYVQVQFKAADTTAFYRKIDDLRIAYRPALINPSVGWHFDGVDDYVNFGTKASLTFLDSDSWTFSHWIKWAVQSLAHVFYAGYMSSNEGFLLRYSNNNRFAFRDKGGGYRVFAVSSSNPYIDLWTHLTWVADGSGNLSLYINGELLDTLTSVPTQLHFDDIGQAYSTSVYNLKGYIALPFIAKAAWSVAQVKNFYRQTKGLFAPRG